MRVKILIAGIALVGVALAASLNGDVLVAQDKEPKVDEKSKNYYYVHSRLGKSTSPQTLKTAKNIADIIEYYPSTWITDYDSVVLHTTSNGRQYKAKSKDAALTSRQQEIISSADMFSYVVFFVKYKETNSITKEVEEKEMLQKIYVRPETQAIYPEGIGELQDFLRNNSEEEVTKRNPEIGFVAIANFTINEEGRPEDIEISESSHYEGIDEVLISVIRDMPTWTPAKDLNGNKVKQKFEFVFGYGRGDGGEC
ncbi:MAG: energy transducer TonB [Bacteroidia bacterium]